ncbi:MAG: hypothetical protein DWH96_00445 [Planctomycetota bacterium]|nr:MAG: hypothetical protein DWH96_00445 [Planctomycetota bacterium]
MKSTSDTAPKGMWQSMRARLRLDRRMQALLWLAAFGTVVWAKPMGLLLWARLRILTSLPRTAIADDPSVQANAAEAPKVQFLDLSDSGTVDPFRLRGSRLCIPHSPIAPSVISAEGAKSNELVADSPLSSEAVDLVALCAKRFRVQTAGSGLSCAVVNGRTYRLGDELELEGLRFLLIEVREVGVILGYGERRFEIRIGLDRS